jgi:hypothetical protein
MKAIFKILLRKTICISKQTDALTIDLNKQAFMSRGKEFFKAQAFTLYG